jgi:membrane associated rhomboid family serine protease
MELLYRFEQSVSYTTSRQIAKETFLELICEKEMKIWNQLFEDQNTWVVQWNLENDTEQNYTQTRLTVSFPENQRALFSLEYYSAKQSRNWFSKKKESTLPINLSEDLKRILARIVSDFENRLSKKPSYKVDNANHNRLVWSENIHKKMMWKYQGVLFNPFWNRILNLFILALVPLLSTLVFVLSAFKEGGIMEFSTATAIDLGGSYNLSVYQGEWYRFFTGPFFHFGFVHYIYNIIIYLVLASFLFHRYGPFFNLIFIIAMLQIPFAFDYWFLNNREVVVGGISSLIMAILGLLLTRLIPSYVAGIKTFLVYSFLALTYIIITSIAGVESNNIKVSLSGHVSGFLFGIFFGGLIHFSNRYFWKYGNITMSAGIALCICFLMSFFFFQTAKKAPVFKAINIMQEALIVQDSMIQYIMEFNDSNNQVRKEANEAGVRALEPQIHKMHRALLLKLHPDLHERLSLCVRFLEAEKNYYQTFLQYFEDDSLPIDSILQAQTYRDSLWRVFEQ